LATFYQKVEEGEMVKDFLKDFIPPVLKKRINSLRQPWQGDYSSWAEAKNNCSGYDDSGILQKVERSSELVAKGEAVYERDSVLFEEISYSWPLAASLMWTYQKFNKLHVLDFGGSLGSTFYQNCMFTKEMKDFSWTVVEQEKFVQVGLEKFQTAQLKFSSNLDSAFKNEAINLVLFSSVLQYLEEPYQLLANIIEKAPPVIVLDRLMTAKTDRDIITIQKVSSNIYEATYPCRFFNEKNITSILRDKYDLIGRFPSFVGNQGYINGNVPFEDIGHFWIRKKD
jgi:putative methyltransferase (TIGR04325 family)